MRRIKLLKNRKEGCTPHKAGSFPRMDNAIDIRPGADIGRINFYRRGKGTRSRFYLGLFPFEGEKEVQKEKSLKRARLLARIRQLGIPTAKFVNTRYDKGGQSFSFTPDLSRGGRRFLTDPIRFSGSGFYWLGQYGNKPSRVIAGLLRDLAVLHKNGLAIDIERKVLEPWVIYKKSPKNKGMQRAIVDPGCFVETRSRELELYNLKEILSYFSKHNLPEPITSWAKIYLKYNPDTYLERKINKFIEELSEAQRKKE